MKAKNDINETIFTATIKIQKDFPELTKYLDEIPEHFLPISNNEISNMDLKDYLEFLNDLLKTYAKEHRTI